MDRTGQIIRSGLFNNLSKQVQSIAREVGGTFFTLFRNNIIRMAVKKLKHNERVTQTQFYMYAHGI